MVSLEAEETSSLLASVRVPSVRARGRRPDGDDTSSVMCVVRTSKTELSGEVKTLHEFQSLLLSPSYQSSHYPDSRSADLYSQGRTSYELT